MLDNWIPDLDLWDLIVLVFGNTIQTHDRTEQPVVNRDISHGPNKRSPANFQIKKLCCMCLRTTRSPKMRRVSRTHRVALDWFCDLINLDPRIQIEYIDTKNQLADM